MSRPRVSKPSPSTKNLTKDQSTPNFTVAGRKVGGNSGQDKRTAPTPTKPVAKSKASKQPPPPSTADTNPDLENPPSAISTEEIPKINPDNQSETNEVKIVSSEAKIEIEKCPICLDDCTEPKQLNQCGHTFCTDCIDPYFENVKPQCPCCFTIYGEIRGNQPEDGVMEITLSNHRLPGFGRTLKGIIQIMYTFPDGIQNDKHPNPGVPYNGTIREAFLPDNPEGRHVLELLKRAFDLRQTFTIGQSRTTGCDNVVTWNDIHHKTSCTGGMENFGYPDPTYLNRVQQELAAKGIK